MKKFLLLGISVLIIILIGALVLMPSGKNSNIKILGVVAAYSHLSPEQFNSAVKTNKFTLIDIRTTDEYNAGHLANTKQNDFYQTDNFSKFLSSLDKNKNYLIYCRTGHRSNTTLAIMKQKGFKTVYDLAGGYNAWVAAGYPTEL
jgi:rhodanese-related sulfurtransferase